MVFPKQIYLEVTNKQSYERQAGEHDLNRGDIFSLFSHEILPSIQKVVIFARTDVMFCTALFRVVQTITHLVPQAEILVLTNSAEFKKSTNLPVTVELRQVLPTDITEDAIHISAEGNVFPFLWQGEFSDKVKKLNALIQTNPLHKVVQGELFTKLRHTSLADVVKTTPELLEFHIDQSPHVLIESSIAFPNTSSLTAFVKPLADRIFNTGLFSDKPSGIEFFIDENFNEIETSDKLMVVPWKSPNEVHRETFFVVSGDYLNDLTPHSAEIFQQLNDIGIQFSYRGDQGICVLIGMETVFRHTDIGGRCVFNQTLWGADKFCVNVWKYGAAERWMFNDADFSNLPPAVVASTKVGNIWVLDTTKDHSSITTQQNNNTIGIINLQCTIPFANAINLLKDAGFYESD